MMRMRERERTQSVKRKSFMDDNVPNVSSFQSTSIQNDQEAKKQNVDLNEWDKEYMPDYNITFEELSDAVCRYVCSRLTDILYNIMSTIFLLSVKTLLKTSRILLLANLDFWIMILNLKT